MRGLPTLHVKATTLLTSRMRSEYDVVLNFYMMLVLARESMLSHYRIRVELETRNKLLKKLWNEVDGVCTSF